MSHPPDDLDDLDRMLRGVRFEPRSSLGPEVVGRWHRGERPLAAAWDDPRLLLGLLGAALLLGLALFALWLMAGQPLRRTTVDRCCQDLDGGGDADDGVLIVSQQGKRVHRLAIYEDRDHSGGLSPGDTIRFDRQGDVALTQPLGEGVRTIEFCCLDYDGGGPSDDALVVVGAPPDRISMAAIYERWQDPGPIRLR